MGHGLNDSVLIVEVFKVSISKTVAVYIGCAICVRIALKLPKFCIES